MRRTPDINFPHDNYIIWHDGFQWVAEEEAMPADDMADPSQSSEFKVIELGSLSVDRLIYAIDLIADAAACMVDLPEWYEDALRTGGRIQLDEVFWPLGAVLGRAHGPKQNCIESEQSSHIKRETINQSLVPLIAMKSRHGKNCFRDSGIKIAIEGEYFVFDEIATDNSRIYIYEYKDKMPRDVESLISKIRRYGATLGHGDTVATAKLGVIVADTELIEFTI